MGKTVSIFNQKGGVGKTTTCVNFAAALGYKGKKTLLVDVDPQGNSTSGVGIDKAVIANSTYDMLINKVPAKDIMMQTEFNNLYILPATMNLAGAELELAESDERYTALKKGLAPIVAEFDYIIIDCPPSLILYQTGNKPKYCLRRYFSTRDIFCLLMSRQTIWIQRRGKFWRRICARKKALY